MARAISSHVGSKSRLVDLIGGMKCASISSVALLTVIVVGMHVFWTWAPFFWTCTGFSDLTRFFPRASERRVLPIVGVCISSSHLHSFSSSHLLIFTIFTSSSHLLIFTASHLHIFSSSHLLIFTSSHPHIFSSSHLRTFSSSQLLIFTSLLIFSS